MPRLSIIVPCQNDVEHLEATLLSLLENRPRDCEILVVHDGSYEDPYALQDDEVVMIETEGQSSLIESINEAVQAAKGPIVHILKAGMVVEPGWIEAALPVFQDTSVASVSVRLDSILERGSAFGVETDWLPRRSVVRQLRNGKEVSPFLEGTFFRRRVLLALDGFLELGSIEATEAEFGLAVRGLGMRHIATQESTILYPGSFEHASQTSYASGLVAGQLGNAYKEHVVIDVNSGSFLARLSHLAGGLISPSSVAERLGWVMGVKDRSLVNLIADRLELADERLDAWRATLPVGQTATRRRAA